MAWKILYIFWRIIGICPFGLKDWKTIRVSYFGVVQSVIISFTYFVCYTQIASHKTNFYLKYQTTMNKIADVVGHTLECAMFITIWISFGVRQKQLCTIQKSFFRVIEACKALGIQETHNNVMKRVQYQVVIGIITWSLFYLYDIIYPPKRLKTVISYFFCTCHCVLPNFIIFYCGIVTLMRDQFRSLNCKLQEVIKLNTRIMSIDESKRNNRPDKTGIEFPVGSDPLSAIGQIHTEMVHLTKSIIGFLSPSLYTLLMVHLVQLSSIIYSLSYAVVTKLFFEREHWAGYMVLAIWFFIHTYMMIAEIGIADSATEEANRASNILHGAPISKASRKDNDSVMIWSLRLLQEPLTMDLFGVIQMKYSLLYRMFGLIVAYCTLLIQMDDQRS